MWFQALLNNTMISVGKLAELIASFHSTFLYKSCPDDMTLFVGRATYEDDKDQVLTRVYSTPACINHFPPMAFDYFTTACEKLNKDELTFLVRPEDAFDRIYVSIELSDYN
jgi:hypothetical protein